MILINLQVSVNCLIIKEVTDYNGVTAVITGELFYILLTLKTRTDVNSLFLTASVYHIDWINLFAVFQKQLIP